MNFKIPYEAGKTSPIQIALYKDKGYQLPYTADAAENGFYREWISEMDEDALDTFIKENEVAMNDYLKNKTTGPNWARIRVYIYRNALYMVEKHLRHETDTAKLDEDLFLYHGEWKGKYERAIAEFLKSDNNVKSPEEKSGINPYY